MTVTLSTLVEVFMCVSKWIYLVLLSCLLGTSLESEFSDADGNILHAREHFAHFTEFESFEYGGAQADPYGSVSFKPVEKWPYGDIDPFSIENFWLVKSEFDTWNDKQSDSGKLPATAAISNTAVESGSFHDQDSTVLIAEDTLETETIPETHDASQITNVVAKSEISQDDAPITAGARIGNKGPALIKKTEKSRKIEDLLRKSDAVYKDANASKEIRRGAGRIRLFYHLVGLRNAIEILSKSATKSYVRLSGKLTNKYIQSDTFEQALKRVQEKTKEKSPLSFEEVGSLMSANPHVLAQVMKLLDSPLYLGLICQDFLNCREDDVRIPKNSEYAKERRAFYMNRILALLDSTQDVELGTPTRKANRRIDLFVLIASRERVAKILLEVPFDYPISSHAAIRKALIIHHFETDRYCTKYGEMPLVEGDFSYEQAKKLMTMKDNSQLQKAMNYLIEETSEEAREHIRKLIWVENK